MKKLIFAKKSPKGDFRRLLAIYLSFFLLLLLWFNFVCGEGGELERGHLCWWLFFLLFHGEGGEPERAGKKVKKPTRVFFCSNMVLYNETCNRLFMCVTGMKGVLS